MKATNLTFSALVKLMHQALREFDYLAQRDAISDIADLAETCDLYSQAPARGFFRFWGLRLDGAHLCRTNDFGYWEPQIADRYCISFEPGKGWSIERLEK